MGRNFKYFNRDRRMCRSHSSLLTPRPDRINFLSGSKKKKETKKPSHKPFPLFSSHYYSYYSSKCFDAFRFPKFILLFKFLFLQSDCTRIKYWREKRRIRGNVRTRAAAISQFAIAARRNKIGSSRWRQVIGARIDAKLVKPGCILPSKRG